MALEHPEEYTVIIASPSQREQHVRATYEVWGEAMTLDVSLVWSERFGEYSNTGPDRDVLGKLG
jgi:hypothetical protein